MKKDEIQHLKVKSKLREILNKEKNKNEEILNE